MHMSQQALQSEQHRLWDFVRFWAMLLAAVQLVSGVLLTPKSCWVVHVAILLPCSAFWGVVSASAPASMPVAEFALMPVMARWSQIRGAVGPAPRIVSLLAYRGIHAVYQSSTVIDFCPCS